MKLTNLSIYQFINSTLESNGENCIANDNGEDKLDVIENFLKSIKKNNVITDFMITEVGEVNSYGYHDETYHIIYVYHGKISFFEAPF